MESLEKTAELKACHTEQNFISTLSSAIENQTQITEINFSYLPKRTKEKFFELFAKINISNLQKLIFTNSYLTEADFKIIFSKKFKLTALNISSNSIGVDKLCLNFLINHENCSQIQDICLKNNKKVDDSCLEIITNCESFQNNLQILNIANCAITNLDPIFEKLKKLQELNASRNFISRLYQSMPNFLLKKLDISYTSIDGKNLKEFIDTSALTDLNYLNISKSILRRIEQNDICDNIGKSSEKLNNLENLSLNSLYLEKKDIFDLFQKENGLNKLKILKIDNNLLTDKGFEALFNYKNFKNLEEISLKNCLLKDLSEFSNTNLKKIDVSNNKEILDKIAIKLLKNINNNIQEIAFSECNLTEETLEFIANNDKFSEIVKINLSGNCYLKDTSIEILTKSKKLQKLKFLNVSNCGLTDISIENFIKWEISNNLVDLRISENKISGDALTKMANNLDCFQSLKNFAGGYYVSDGFENIENFGKRNIAISAFFADEED